MGRKSPFILGALLLAGILIGWIGKSLAAGEAVVPGSQQDPLVSRSYVDGKLGVTIVEVPAGKRVTFSAGAEVIVRSGSATVIDSNLGGLADVTSGKDLRKGEQAPANHLLIVPRDDGRGLQIVTPVFLMVRGDYKVQP